MFQSVRLHTEYEVQVLFELAATARPSESTDHSYIIDLEIANNHSSHTVDLVQVSTLSPTWDCAALRQETT
jgi:hypothetical protein